MRGMSMMDDHISRQAAIAHAVPLNLFGREVMMVSVSELENLPSVQSEPAIPLSWIEGQIEWLKSLDNAFSTLTAGQILAMMNKWKDEQNDGCSQVSERKESDV